MEIVRQPVYDIREKLYGYTIVHDPTSKNVCSTSAATYMFILVQYIYLILFPLSEWAPFFAVHRL